jgi:hypothetical protein
VEKHTVYQTGNSSVFLGSILHNGLFLTRQLKQEMLRGVEDYGAVTVLKTENDLF